MLYGDSLYVLYSYNKKFSKLLMSGKQLRGSVALKALWDEQAFTVIFMHLWLIIIYRNQQIVHGTKVSWLSRCLLHLYWKFLRNPLSRFVENSQEQWRFCAMRHLWSDLTKVGLDAHSKQVYFPPPVDSFIHQLYNNL